MKRTKRDFILGTGFLGMASLAGAAPASSPEKTGAQSPSVFNVRDFDAKGDGTTPDSDAIQKALDAAGAVSGTGKYTPQVGFILRKLSYAVIANNTLYRGFMDQMVVDLGEHGDGYVFANNVGCPMKEDVPVVVEK